MFKKIGYTSIVIGVLSLIIGAYLNDLVYRKNNEKLLAQLRAELALNNTAKARMTGGDNIQAELRSREIEAQIRLVEKQLS